MCVCRGSEIRIPAQRRQTLRNAFAIRIFQQCALRIESLRHRVYGHPRRRKQHRHQEGDRYEPNGVRIKLVRNLVPAYRLRLTRRFVASIPFPSVT